MALSLVSINIEGGLHLEKVQAFIEEAQPDVLCIQELLKSDIPLLEELMGGKCFYAPMMVLPAGTRIAPKGETVVMGVGIITRLPRSREVVHYYHRSAEDMPVFIDGSPEEKRKTQHCVLAVSEVMYEGALYRIGTTHFTWTPRGNADEYQRTDIRALLSLLKKESPVIVCGDFNAPRGGEIFSLLAREYKDNIPVHYKTSLDISVHRAGETDGENLSKLMVDGLFTSPEYEARDVSLRLGVSDHAAIVAMLEKV
ncbi:endonuclease/exonuclease/phosphatase family protein [Patescibacteria group bacterium]|nr:endonuclease/exonuclease/phosphatase family protein [Patescibacteria group bacterium]